MASASTLLSRALSLMSARNAEKLGLDRINDDVNLAKNPKKRVDLNSKRSITRFVVREAAQVLDTERAFEQLVDQTGGKNAIEK